MHQISSEMESPSLGRQVCSWLAVRVSEWTVGVPERLVDRLVVDIDRDLEDMRLITRHDAGPEALLPERLGLLGLDLAALEHSDPGLVRALEMNCRRCPHWRRCARDLGQGLSTCDNYCANVELLRPRRPAC